jgi:hypothetical protein
MWSEPCSGKHRDHNEEQSRRKVSAAANPEPSGLFVGDGWNGEHLKFLSITALKRSI